MALLGPQPGSSCGLCAQSAPQDPGVPKEEKMVTFVVAFSRLSPSGCGLAWPCSLLWPREEPLCLCFQPGVGKGVRMSPSGL